MFRLWSQEGTSEKVKEAQTHPAPPWLFDILLRHFSGAEGGSGSRADGSGRGSSAQDRGEGRSHRLPGGRVGPWGGDARGTDGKERKILSFKGGAVLREQLKVSCLFVNIYSSARTDIFTVSEGWVCVTASSWRQKLKHRYARMNYCFKFY